MVEIEVPTETVKLGLAMGLMRVVAEDVVELTEAGDDWLREYCRRVGDERG